MSNEALFNSSWLKDGEVGQERKKEKKKATKIIPISLSQPLNAQEISALLQRQ